MDIPPIITLLTDFGTSDAYVGAMKGVILSIQPAARIVDLTHEIPAHDVRTASFTLHGCAPLYPQGSIHVAVVDPGVGGSRRPIIVSAVGHFFIGPDNGLFTGILDTGEVTSCHVITARHYMRETVSPTFHGRDIFAPAAAWLSRGVSPDQFGERVEDPVRFELPEPRPIEGRAVRVTVLHVDRFGNVVLTLKRNTLEEILGKSGRAGLRLAFRDGEAAADEIRETYEGARPGRPFFIFGSTGHLEISVDRDSAARMTGLTPGSEVDLELV